MIATLHAAPNYKGIPVLSVQVNGQPLVQFPVDPAALATLLATGTFNSPALPVALSINGKGMQTLTGGKWTDIPLVAH